MLRARTKNRKPRFFRGGVEFGRGWLALTEPGDPIAEDEKPDLNKAQAKAIRAEKRFLEVESIPADQAKKILSPQGGKSGSKNGKPAGNSSAAGSQGNDPAPKGAGESSNNAQPKGKDPSGNASAGGEPNASNPGSNDPGGNDAAPKGEGPVDLNSGSKAELQAVGLSAKAAGAVIGYRKKLAKDGKRFEAVDQLTEVHGIGDETLAVVREALTV